MSPINLYFAYGYNMNIEKLELRLGKVTVLGTADLKDYQIRYNAAGRTSVYLNIEKNKGSYVNGVLYYLSDEQFKILDVFEGCVHPEDPHHPDNSYSRELKEVTSKSDPSKLHELHLLTEDKLNTTTKATVIAQVYIAQKINHHGRPTPDYVLNVQKGAKAHGFPEQNYESV